MAEPNFLQRGLTTFRDVVREARSGEGKGVGAAMGRAARGAAGKAKASLGKLKKTLGFSDVDQMEPDEEQPRRRRRARELLGDEEPNYAAMSQRDTRRDLSTVAPEFRAQVSSGLAAANSMTAGSTLVDGGKGGKGGDERW